MTMIRCAYFSISHSGKDEEDTHIYRIYRMICWQQQEGLQWREKAGLPSLTRRHIWRMNDACVASGHEKQLKGNLLEGGEKRERFLFRNGKLTVCYFSDSLKLYLSYLPFHPSHSRFLSHSKALSFSSSNLLSLFSQR